MPVLDVSDVYLLQIHARYPNQWEEELFEYIANAKAAEIR